MAATGGTRAARARRHEHGHQRDADADEDGDDDRAGRHHDVRRGKAGAGGVEEGDDAPGDEHAGGDADDRGEDRDQERFGEHHPTHLARRRPDGAEQGKFLESLTDRDGEDVVDDERTHECRDEREAEQAVAEEPDELVDAFGRLVRHLLTRDHLGALGQSSGDRRLHLCRVSALGDADVDHVEEPA